VLDANYRYGQMWSCWVAVYMSLHQWPGMLVSVAANGLLRTYYHSRPEG